VLQAITTLKVLSYASASRVDPRQLTFPGTDDAESLPVIARVKLASELRRNNMSQDTGKAGGILLEKLIYFYPGRWLAQTSFKGIAVRFRPNEQG